MHQLGFKKHICACKTSIFSNPGAFSFYQEFAISEVTEKQCFPFSSSCTWPLLPYPAFWLEKKIENSPKTLLRLGMCMSMGHETFMEPVFYTISGISEYITENVINEAESLLIKYLKDKEVTTFFLFSEVLYRTSCSSIWGGKMLQGLKGGWKAGG